MRFEKIIWKLFVILAIGTLSCSAQAATGTDTPKVVVIIDNLGDQEQTGAKAADLPGQITCSILPHARHSAKIAELCHQKNKSVILNTPMQALNNYPLGPGGLRADMPQATFVKTLVADMQSVPYIQGLDNHMGSLLTAQTVPMNWLMQTIKTHGLFFLDNKTSPHSIAAKAAGANQVPFISRDIFLDNERTAQAIHKQWQSALKIAKRYGVAVVVAHPYSVTLDYLQTALPQAQAQGYQLASIPQALNISIEPVTLAKDASQTAIEINEATPENTDKINLAATEKPAVTEAAKPLKKALPPAPVKEAPAKKPSAAAQPVKETPAPVESKAEQIPLPLSAASVNTAANMPDASAQPQVKAEENKPGLLTRWWKKAAGVFAHKTPPAEQASQKPQQSKHETAAPDTASITPAQIIPPPAKQAEKTAVKPLKKQQEDKNNITAPVISPAMPQAAAKKASNNLAAAQATAQASHSLLHTIKEDFCNKYSHLCTYHKKANNKMVNPASMPFVQLQGNLPWPTAGNILTPFGAELGDSHLKYNGVLIGAPAGQPVHAIARGKVVFANWLQGLGLLLIIDHGDGYMSLYGHNAALYKKAGDSVKPEEVIAAVGNSGVPGPMGLYFEIRHNGQPVNPVQWCK